MFSTLLFKVLVIVAIQENLYSTVEPLLSAKLDYPRFLRPKFGNGTPNLYL